MDLKVVRIILYTPARLRFRTGIKEVNRSELQVRKPVSARMLAR